MMPLRTAYSVLAALSPAAMVCIECSLASSLGVIVGHMPAPANAQTAVPIATAKSISPPAALNGTLFTTREQRERLDRVRSRGGAAEDEAEADTEPRRSVINGFVKRSDGRNTVWIDDIMKRDPRAEVAEQLEPNMVGGNIALRRTTSAVEGTVPPTIIRRPTIHVAKHARKHMRKIVKPTLRRMAVVK